MALLLGFLFVIQAQTGLQAIVASRLVLSEPAVVAELSGARLPGFPLRLTWSPDSRELYLRLVRQDRWGNEAVRHTFVALADGQLRTEDREPAWSHVYWAWKSGPACPGFPEFVLDTETRTESVSATSAGAGGAIAQNSGDPYGPGFELGAQGQAIMSRAMQSQTVTTVWMRIKGQPVSEFVNTRPIPGLMFGWAPEGLGGVAYADRKRRLVVMDRAGRRHEARATKGVLLPAWSTDGSRLAWLEQSDSKKVVIYVADVRR